MATESLCPVCHSGNVTHIFSKPSMPKYNLERHRNRECALAAQRGDLDYYLCLACGFAFNAAFDSADMDYAIDYESSRAYSGFFSAYLDRICHDINQAWSATNKCVVEVGCGDGQFLLKLREKYHITGYGFDASFGTEHIQHSYEDVHFIQGLYGPERLSSLTDILILRHILEHQKDPHLFLDPILATTTPMTRLYVEVPAWEWIVDHHQIHAFHYEHCSYFSQYALELALRSHHFYADRISFCFAGEYLQYFGTRHGPFQSRRARDNARKAVIQKTELFKRAVPKILEGLRSQLDALLPHAVLWGAAGKGTTLLNILDVGHGQLEYVVDSNPRRHNTFIPGTGQQVVAPEFLQELRPDYVLLTNSNYTAEISSQLATMNVRAEIVPLDDLRRRLVAAVTSSRG